ncbi:MAG: hypothetical protein KatS3mg103_0559 [Phycisphaerales bacterium]|nr:MAG: hypothetical protein KatS3mg103_0559 [Phycisphaerales bacterium]
MAEQAGGRRVLVTSPIEHAAVRELARLLESCGCAQVRWLPIGPGGIVDVAGAESLFDDSVAVLSVQWANNETGAIQPIEALAELARDAGAMVHVDGTQWVGRMPTDVGGCRSTC